MTGKANNAFATVEAILNESEKALPLAFHLRDLAVSLAPKLQQVHQAVDEVITILLNYSPQARGLHYSFLALKHRCTETVRSDSSGCCLEPLC